MTLYHGSPVSSLTVLKPQVTRYFGKPRQVCLTASLPMALLYGLRHYEYTYGYTGERQIYYEEYFPNALWELYQGKRASLYRCVQREDMEPTLIPNEYVTPLEVPVEEERIISDVYQALLEQERLGALRIVRWEEVSPARRAWILQAEAGEIRERKLLDRPEDPFARYMREKYPDSWALAEKKRKEEE